MIATGFAYSAILLVPLVMIVLIAYLVAAFTRPVRGRSRRKS